MVKVAVIKLQLLIQLVLSLLLRVRVVIPLRSCS